MIRFWPWQLRLGWIIQIFMALAACSPKIYLIDRQSVLEEEVSGEWPDFEAELLNQTQASGPTPFPQVASSHRKKRLYQILNGEVHSTQATPSPDKK